MLPNLDWRLILGLLWGGGVVWTYGSVLAIRVKANRAHHDRRTRRDVNAAIALFITALGSGLATVFVIAGSEGSGMRAFLTALALGSFLGAGLIMRSEAKTEAHDDPKVDE